MHLICKNPIKKNNFKKSTKPAFTAADELYDFMVTHNKLGKGDAESVK